MEYLRIAKRIKKDAAGNHVVDPRNRYRSRYKDAYAIENIIRYVTRTRPNESRRDELLFYGALGVRENSSIEEMIHMFEYVQRNCRKQNDGPKLFHEFYHFDDTRAQFFLNNIDKLMYFAYNSALIYYNMGFQVVYAAHYEPSRDDETSSRKGYSKGLHIHYVVNAVNFLDGKKWHTNLGENQRSREEEMSNIYPHPFIYLEEE
ncbi:hypothetical protein SAMN02910292_03021 [Lachnospiraceae bacterium XBB2008]|nr:hypothetical protein SAMN02910292_03021 [Lachnospiraceae bacterium XBB2008]